MVDKINYQEDEQLAFRFFSDVDILKRISNYSYRKIQQYAIAFLQKSFNISAIAVDVAVGVKNYKCSLAAISKVPKSRKLNSKNLETIILEIYLDRDKCFNYCANANKIHKAIERLTLQKETLEFIIRANEPELQANDDLFIDFPTYNYAESSNKEYKRVINELATLTTRLHNGGKLENIRLGQVANRLYLVVPENLILVEECAYNWGLIYFNENLEFKIVKEPIIDNISLVNQQNLVFNIAMAAEKNVLFSHGVKILGDKEIKLLAPPKQRRKKS